MNFPNLCIELKDNFLLIRVLADLNGTIAQEVREAFNYVVEHADRSVRLDLSLSNEIDASGLGSIAFLFKRLKSLDFDLELTGVKASVLVLLHELNINKIIRTNSNKSCN